MNPIIPAASAAWIRYLGKNLHYPEEAVNAEYKAM